jgi:hypothetical protein
MPDDEDELGEGGQVEERGRSGRAKRMFSAGPPRDLEVVREGEVAQTPGMQRNGQRSQPNDADSADEGNKTWENEPQTGPQLQLFSLVLVIDKPDPDRSGVSRTSPYGMGSGRIEKVGICKGSCSGKMSVHHRPTHIGSEGIKY